MIWLLDLREVPAGARRAFEDGLTPEARERARRITGSVRRAQFIAGRALLRHAAARIAGCELNAVAISEHDRGWPRVEVAGTELPHCSISHSGHWVACAVHVDTALGLDVEVANGDRDLDGISERTFSANEREWILSQPDRTLAFYSLWTRKEAMIKLASALDEPGTVAGAWHHEQTAAGLALSVVWAATSGRATTPAVAPLLRVIHDPSELLN